ncbi:predicted protein [Plenodomus lingam JN3]|uniref:Predicted protein n=2 Tax=Leptosphaeria maculans TaxID=5022 RepID=E4ZPI9_LEPMJ|nr:predicted protein [Plenodomus lingam JN3]CBX93214.1 predicted protein [Plenodomus lingam JN3]
MRRYEAELIRRMHWMCRDKTIYQNLVGYPDIATCENGEICKGGNCDILPALILLTIMVSVGTEIHSPSLRGKKDGTGTVPTGNRWRKDRAEPALARPSL